MTNKQSNNDLQNDIGQNNNKYYSQTPVRE